MSTLPYPAILIDLERVGEAGIPLQADRNFQSELTLCTDLGFKIHAANDRVRLLFDHDQLVPTWIQRETPSIAWDSLNVKGFLRVQSTNTEAHWLVEQGAPGGTLVFAEEQSAGRGRQNRAWHSPAGAGLYCTLILRPRQARTAWPLLTHVASVALAETLKGLCDDERLARPLNVDIKWPNDVLLSGKKCAGILLEAIGDDGCNSAALIGFGVNVRKESVPEMLTGMAACLDEMAGTTIPRRKVLVRFLHQFQLCYLMFEHGRHGELLERWKSCSSMWNGAQIYIGRGEKRREAVTCGINDMGALMVRNAEGLLETLLAEDVSICQRNL